MMKKTIGKKTMLLLKLLSILKFIVVKGFFLAIYISLSLINICLSVISIGGKAPNEPMSGTNRWH